MTKQTCPKKYMYTKENWNPNVYDININYDKIPKNRHIPISAEAEEVVSRALPMSQKNFIKFQTDTSKDTNKVNVLSDYYCLVQNLVQTITPNDLIDVQNGVINNSNNLEPTGELNCTAKTQLLNLGVVKTISLESKLVGCFYEMYSANNELLKKYDSNNIDVSNMYGTIYLKIIIKPGSYWTSLKTFVPTQYPIKKL